MRFDQYHKDYFNLREIQIFNCTFLFLNSDFYRNNIYLYILSVTRIVSTNFSYIENVKLRTKYIFKKRPLHLYEIFSLHLLWQSHIKSGMEK